MVIMDKMSTSEEKDVLSSAKPLWNDDVEVIPIAFVPESDAKELNSITPHDNNVISAGLANKTKAITEEIMDKVRKGI